MENKTKIFVSYSHQNEDWVSKEGKYKLIPWLESQLTDQAEVWTDNSLKRLIGEEFAKHISEKIESTDIVLLLISQDFVSSSFILEKELPIIHQQYEAKKIKVLPLLLTSLTTRGKEKIRWIFDLQTYPNDTRPLIDFVNNDSEWAKMKVEILDGIENKIEEVIQAKKEQFEILPQLEIEREERERNEAEKERIERERKQKHEFEKVERERQEAERIDKENLEAEKAERERVEKERVERENREPERQERIFVNKDYTMIAIAVFLTIAIIIFANIRTKYHTMSLYEKAEKVRKDSARMADSIFGIQR